MHLPLPLAVALLCMLVWPPGAAANPEPRYFLRADKFSCIKQEAAALEAILDAKDESQRTPVVTQAIFKGACMGGSELGSPIKSIERRQSPGGVAYSCFRLLDLMDHTDQGAYCAPDTSIGNVEADIQSRQGSYRVTMEGKYMLKAECLEGGHIRVFMNPEGWQRASAVFPYLNLEQLTREIPRDRERALRDGCKGLDHQ